MNLTDIPFRTIDWSGIEPTTHPESYVVADGDGAHRSRTDGGARLFIVD